MHYNPAPPIMRCRIKSLVSILFSVGFVSSLLLMVYNVTNSSMPLLPRNASILLNKIPPDILPDIPPDDFIQLMNFNDLGSGKERVDLLVVTNSAPHKSDRRMAIRSTWWRHCNESQVLTKSYFCVGKLWHLTLLLS